jgi:hypothetical protein
MYPSLKAQELRNALKADDRAAVVETYPQPGTRLPGDTLVIPVLARD